MSYRVFGVFRQSIDQGLDPVDLRFSFILRALYPKESSLPLVEFLQGRFKNIEEGFHHCKSLFVAPFPNWRTRLRLLRSRRISNFTLILFAVALLMSGSNNLRARARDLTVEMLVLMQSTYMRGGLSRAHRARALEPQIYEGALDAKELENFLFNM
ncbi:hypothetical protein BHM03_00013122 [Ensete ventricosum]|nr:hypothetical protein BHM03_00013122 [Ensete ventricosum]